MRKVFIDFCIVVLVAISSSCNIDEEIAKDLNKGDFYRAKTADSKPDWNKVYEYTPAPGQFINELKTGGFDGTQTTPEAAVAYAEARMSQTTADGTPNPIWVSLAGYGGTVLENICFVLYMVVMVNLNLAVFNLLPAPPFDGSRIVNLILPERLYFLVMRYERYIMLAILLVFYIGVLDAPLAWLREGMFGALNWASGYVDAIAYRILT